MRVPKLFIPEKNLSDKIKDIFKNGKYYNSKYKFRIDLKAFKTDKEFLITYLIPKTYPESDTVRLRIEQIQSSEEDYENFVDLSMSLCSYHGYSIILLGQQKKKEKLLGVCQACSKDKVYHEDLISGILKFYSEKTDCFKILRTVLNNKSYTNNYILANYGPL